MSALGNKLKALRKSKKLTQKEVGLKMGITQVNYGRWETGRNEPNIAKIILLANFYNVSTDYLLGHLTTEEDNNFFSQKDILLIQLEDIEKLSNEIEERQQVLKREIIHFKKMF
ncbi:helix-turn-helix domain-containing protein [Lactococcus lactis]|uniref:helix-turn-helix domain-containing protein n=1 Tax=Lactococcus lactis TaxID=1358 RepID=UPI001913AC6F|nr:helix-turn-helix transcriptional regulator [Lactococcus lactis]WDA68712.1 helix-turn-helix transcriptional regulator [Lactococcus lactis]